MKNILLFLGLAILPLTNALALPTTASSKLVRRLTEAELEAITDEDLFSISITEFESRRNAQDPAELDWSSDGCSSSPDNPLGFNFVPSCHRHDFGYRNYKAQDRFTDANKARIDLNFKNDLDNQCETESFESACHALAEVYYQAVKEFGSK
ncbi:hypothetical protein DV738_g2705, partial [Chaetothyriales sp. CBS 135597]